MENKIGRLIAKLRKQAHMSQEELAYKTGVNRMTVSRWETGKLLPSSKNLLRLAEIFEIDSSIFVSLITTIPLAEISQEMKADPVEREVSRDESDVHEPVVRHKKRYYIGITLFILALAALATVLTMALFVPAEGDTYINNMIWQLSSTGIVVLIILGVVLMLLLGIGCIMHLLKKYNNKKNNNDLEK